MDNLSLFGQQLTVAGFTTLLGFLVYVSGQIITAFYIEPIHDQRRVIGEIADAIIFYANKYHYYPLSIFPSNLVRDDKTKDQKEIISDSIRKLGTGLISKTHMIPLYEVFAFLHIVKPMKNILKAKKALIGLSNLVGSPDRNNQQKFEDEIRKSLGIFNPE